MPRTVFGLLVGIDEYAAPVPPLSGCVNDVEAVEELLRDLGVGGDFVVDLRVLKNAAATRDAIIEGFRNHLCRAGPEDVAFFHYSGHGSQEASPPELWHLEPDRLDETLVCFDSRNEGQWDLADKELSVLIAEIAQREPHILCVLDCCHSGSGTRDVDEDGLSIRRAPDERRHRSIDTFLRGTGTSTTCTESGVRPTGWKIMPASKHVLLAGCRSSETAKEAVAFGRKHGAFTGALLTALSDTRGAITYRDLHKRAEAQLRLRVNRQTPQIEATSVADLRRPFLGGIAGQGASFFTLRFDKMLDWVIDGGAVHGIAPATPSETTTLAIFDLVAEPVGVVRISDALAIVEIIEVRPELSRVQFQSEGCDLDRTSTYRAVIVATPFPALAVLLSGVERLTAQLRDTLEKFHCPEGTSPFLREIAEGNAADIRVDASTDGFRIYRSGIENLPVSVIGGSGDEAVRNLLAQLEHIARWQTVYRLDNPVSGLKNGTVEIVISVPVVDPQGETRWLETGGLGHVRLEYQRSETGWMQPRMLISLHNRGNKPVYCALLWLGEDYSISSELIIGGTVRIPPGGFASANNGKPVWGRIPDDVWGRGRTAVHDLLKLVVSTEQFDPTLLDQAELGGLNTQRNARPVNRTPRNVLERLTSRVGNRAFAMEPGGNEMIAEWATDAVSITVARQIDEGENL